MKPVATLLLLASSTLASAATSGYAMQWAVHPDRADAGAYALTLTPEIYRTARRADLRDVDVLDAHGDAVPVDIVAPSARPSTARIALPWYAMPSPRAADAAEWRVIADLDADGRLRGLRSSGTAAAAGASALLVDAGTLRSSVPGNELVALDLDWADDATFDRAYRVEASDDFDAWHEVARGRLVDIRQGGRRLRLHRLEFGAVPMPRYLRLVPEGDGAALPAITAVRAEVVRATDAPPQWLALDPKNGGRGVEFAFESPGRYPVRWVDLDVDGNDAREWRLQSRDGDGRWVDRIDGWVAYRVGARRSPPQEFDRPIRDRRWRVVSSTDGAPPRLRIGYRPERLVFVAAGDAPYTVVAGSAVAMRASRPVRATLDSAVPPASARLGPMRTRAGAAALERPWDWKTWGLWGVLALGVLIVGGFALRLLREPTPAVD